MNLTVLETDKTDKERANELRAKFIEALQPVADLITEAEKAGFEVGFQFGKGPMQNTQIQMVNLLKKF